jgi:hypothetical protein
VAPLDLVAKGEIIMPRLRTAIHSARDRDVLPQYRPDGNVRMLARRLDLTAPISMRSFIRLLDSLHVVIPPPPVVTPPPQPLPHITVGTDGSGASAVFKIDGTQFNSNATVTVRVVDDALAQRTFTKSSEANGDFHMRQSIPCLSGLGLHISATDGRRDPHDLTGVAWSNTVDVSCP